MEHDASRLGDLPAERGRGAKERLRRLERIGDRDSMRHLQGHDVERSRKLEDVERRTNPRGFLRRHQGEGLDAATEREVRKALGRGRSETRR